MTIIQLIPTKQRLEELHHEQKHHLYVNTLRPTSVTVPRSAQELQSFTTDSGPQERRSRSRTPKPRKCKRVTISKTFPFNSCNLVLLKDTSSSLNLALRHSVERYGDSDLNFKAYLVSVYQKMELKENTYDSQVLDFYQFASQPTSNLLPPLLPGNSNEYEAAPDIRFRRRHRRSLLKSVSLTSSVGSEYMSSASSVSSICGLFSLLPMQLIRRKLEDMIKECFHHVSFSDQFVQIVTNLTINTLIQDYSIADENELFMNIIDKKNRQSILETLEETFMFTYVNLKLFSLYDNFIYQLITPPAQNSSSISTISRIITSPVKPQLFYQYYRSIWKLDPDYYSSFPPDDISHDYLVKHQFRPKDHKGQHEELFDNFHNEAFLMTITKYFFIYGKELKHADRNLPFIRGFHPMLSDDEEDEMNEKYSKSSDSSQNEDTEDDNRFSSTIAYNEENRGRLFSQEAFQKISGRNLNNSSDSLDSTCNDSPLTDSDSDSDSCAVSDTETTTKITRSGLFGAAKKSILFLESDDVLQFDNLEPPLYAFCDIHGISVDTLSRA